jgi:hypothetical protein
MEHSGDSSGSRLTNHRTSILFRLPRVHYDRLSQLAGQSDLRRECGPLSLAGRIVIVIIESALAYSDSRIRDERAELRDVPRCIERGRVMRVDSGGGENEIRILPRALRRHRRRGERFADANDRHRARVAGAGDYRVAVTGERRVREVGVTVDED